MAKSPLASRNTHQINTSKQLPIRKNPCLNYTPKFAIYLVASFAIILIFFQIQSLHAPLSTSFEFMHQLEEVFIPNTSSSSTARFEDYKCREELDSMASKLREAITFLPLKDLRYSSKALEGHTWFMSSMLDTQEKGEVQYQEFPSNSSKGRVLCLKGKDTHDGSWNSYAIAWPHALPPNATLMQGLTFVSYNHYNYENIWHGLSAMVPFVAWHIKTRCSSSPTRWILYHWGELRARMGPWLSLLMEAAFEGPLNIEIFQGVDESAPVCFEKAVVMRHNEGGMSRDRRIEVYDLLRCKAREYCNVSLEREANGEGFPVIQMTMFMRTGPRSFKNDSRVIGIFDEACRKVEGCRLVVAYSNNLTFCEQVRLMGSTDVLVSPHGAQLTNMFLMDKNSSVMEFFPKGWLKIAGVGQYVYHWIASWSGMNHRGAWRDPGGAADGPSCEFPDDDRRCMSVYKNARIGHNETYFLEWAKDVLNDHVKLRKAQQFSNTTSTSVSLRSSCIC